MNYKLDVMIMSGVEDGLVLNCSADEKGKLDKNAWSLTVGRRDDNDICLRNDTYMSRHHAYLHFRDNRWWLEDCDSKNGTFIDDISNEDARVSGTIPINPGQLFRVGRTWLRIQPNE
ncbi:MAG: FHA domain-containing protein [Burkholderiales bacterium]|nr:FHA domain-containing protein [Anaerolineae bacterium]